MEALTILAIGISCMGCFLLGAKVGQTVTKGEKVEMPTVNPLKAYREHEAKKEAEMEQESLNTVLQNIEVYDGTSNGQKDVPGR